MCFLSTTNILEAGSDLDGDSGITEPCSERSVIQFAGRLPSAPSVGARGSDLAILQPSPVPRNGPGSHMLAWPGVETPVIIPNAWLFSPLGVKAEAWLISPMDRSVLPGQRDVVPARSAVALRGCRGCAEAVCLGDTRAITHLRSTSDKGQSPVSRAIPERLLRFSVRADRRGG